MNLRQLRVLLVEDDQSTRTTIRVMLSEMGINQIFESSDGQQADTFFEMDALEVDLVISDWNMPEKTGYEFLRALRERNKNLPFIMVTGRSDVNSVQNAIDAGVTSYIRKPFTLGDLEKKILVACKNLSK